jgi:FlaA1/EpsC-like NDP-sugar epimerase
MQLADFSVPLGWLFGLPRVYKRALQVSVDSVLLLASFCLAMALRLESLQFLADWRIWAMFGLVLPLTIAAFIALGFYRAIIRYMTHRAVLSISKGIAISTITLVFAAWQFSAEIPVSVPVMYFLLAFGTVGGIRFAARAMFYRNQSRAKARVIIYGAGQSGRRLANALFQGPDYAPVAFVDDAEELQGAQISGLKVFAPEKLGHLINDYSAKVLLLAIPSASANRRAEILSALERLPIHVQTVPSFDEQINRQEPQDNIREIAIEDLLGRDPVPADPELLRRNLSGQVVLVTGAGGSVGSELCAGILRQAPRKLVLVEISELALYDITERLAMMQAKLDITVPVVAVLANVLDQPRMERLMRRHGVTTVFHAAAYKHVPLVENNATEGLRNNLFGTLSTARAAIATGVRSFTLVSTDKAVRPTSIMGASKRLAELVCRAIGEQSPATRMSIVRFGNVMGSSGSVIPLFKRQIERGGPVEVTHPSATRYFMTMVEAADLVIQAGAITDRDGDLFVLEMGEPVNILDLAKRMIRLYGKVPKVTGKHPDTDSQKTTEEISIIFTGLRPGEKLTEELIAGDGIETTPHPRIYTTNESGPNWVQLEPLLTKLAQACEADDAIALRALLQHNAVAYGPERQGLPKPMTQAWAQSEASRPEGSSARALPLAGE